MMSLFTRLNRRHHTFVRGSLFYMAGEFLVGASKFLLVPVYVANLSPEQYGLMSIVGTITSFVIMFLMVGLDSAVARDFFDYKDDPGGLRAYLRTILVFASAVHVAALPILFAVGPGLTALLVEPDKLPFYPYVAIGVANVPLTVLYGILMVLLRMRQESARFVAAQLARFLLVVGLTLVLLIGVRMDAAGALLAELLSTATVTAYLVRREWAGLRRAVAPAAPARPRAQPLFSWPRLRAALAYGLPLIPHELANWVNARSDRLLLARFRPLDEVGVYTFGVSLAMVLNLVTTAINMAYLPFFFETARKHSEPGRLFSRIAELYVVVVGSICLIGMLLTNELLSLVGPSGYAGASPIIAVVLLAYFLQGLYLLTVPPLFHLKKTRILPVISSLAAAVNLGLNLLVIPQAGAIGAAWTTVAAYAVLFLLVVRTAEHYYPIGYDRLRFWGMALLVGVLGIALHAQPLALRLGGLALFAAIGLICTRNRWGDLAQDAG